MASSTERRYWKISMGNVDVGRGRIVAADCKGSPNLRSLNFGSQEELEQKLLSSSAIENPKVSSAADQLWKFFRLMRPKDLFCQHGKTTRIGWGRIAGDYEFRAGVHSRKVDWIGHEQRSTNSLPRAFLDKLTQDAPIIELTKEEFYLIHPEIAQARDHDDGRVQRENVEVTNSLETALDNHFETLMRALEEFGLLFPAEIVSNYLLALQTKRFVILTGISGTGKTQLALAAARHFQQSITVPHATEMPDGTLEFVVQPTYLKRGLMVLPTAFVANLVNPPTGGNEEAKKIRVEYPDGAQDLTLSKAAAYNVTRLFFSGAFREWFLQSFSVGDRFTMELVQPNDNPNETLRIHVPTIAPTTKLLKNYEVCAVRPDWSDNRGLLGYFNPLIGSYVVTPFLRLLLDASEEVRRATLEAREPAPFFVILDEMNLARVDHYFSDFLSALESGEPIHLHDHQGIEAGETEDAVSVPRQLRIPENVFFTGTVNVDETTYMFSPKVLDRAFTIELNRVDLESFGIENQNSSDSFALTRIGGSLGPAPKPTIADWTRFGELLDGRLKQAVLELHGLLSEDDRHFGYRVANEIARFVVLASEQTQGTDDDHWTALDMAILEKILPKFHGTQQELDSVLSRLIEFINPLPLPRTARKIGAMQRRLQRQGFTSFIE